MNSNSENEGIANENNKHLQWSSEKFSFLGDSMIQKRDSSIKVYREYLADLMEMEPIVYGISGNQWDGIFKQAQNLYQGNGTDIDGILIFSGTNDYNHNLIFIFCIFVLLQFKLETVFGSQLYVVNLCLV